MASVRLLPLLTAILVLGGEAAKAQNTANCTKLSHLTVDADGAPDSYRIDGKGLSYTCDGVFAKVGGVAQTQDNNPSGWQQLCRQYWRQARQSGDYSHVKIVGFETHDGKPVVQGAGDPLPGLAYVTTTLLTIPGTLEGSQRHYVNAAEIPYLVISTRYASRFRLAPGDLIAVYRRSTGRVAYGVYGDCCTLGEGSVRLLQDLGSNPVRVQADGTRRANKSLEEIVWIETLGASSHPTVDPVAWRSEIASVGAAAFANRGGLDSLKACIRGSH